MILVTGCAGFIGHALCLRLLADGKTIVGLDNLNSYYEPKLKLDRLNQLQAHEKFTFIHCDLMDAAGLEHIFCDFGITVVVNLAAQAGVRYSLEYPQAYIDSNITGFLNVLETCVQFHVKHLVYASSSSVYGLNESLPFGTDDRTDSPANLYAVTKKTNELMAFAYNHLHALPVTGLRFFTVYGPWGRPDMAFFKFAKAIIAGKPIDVYNYGNHLRAFTYIDDIVDGILKVMPDVPVAPHIYNIGGDQSVKLLSAIELLEIALGKPALLNMLPMQPGDVFATEAEPSHIKGWEPKITLEEGIQRFVDWYRGYYHS